MLAASAGNKKNNNFTKIKSFYLDNKIIAFLKKPYTFQGLLFPG